MAQSDPDMYFNSFVELVEKETKKLEEETKKEQKLKKVLEISKSSSEEEEKEEKDLLAGKITDLSKREEIIERIEKKLEIKLRA